MLAAFAAAPAVTASYPRGDLRRSTERLPSRWLRSAEAEEKPSYATALATTPELASEQEWRIRVALAGDADRPDRAAGRADARGPRPCRADPLRRRPVRAPACPTRPDGSVISPTSLEAWARCPHGYFVQKLLRVRPIESPEEQLTITPIELGNLYHETLDRFFAEQDARGAVPGGPTPWTVAQRADLRRIAVEEAEDLAVRGQTGHRLLWRRELAGVPHATRRLPRRRRAGAGRDRPPAGALGAVVRHGR